ncbi:peptide chain release factor 1-like, mitochondrial isoform X1 [Varroa jacobsoni]|uniref:Prokaryotic-type class I peptide chain release factors domain-containing protein n=1 Tax=Varroa destructor TaxID=109461 RepID=A0A7M7JIE0_VARDE|nr:peptide chain release factor 1-like, mitochondrial [Varroa destructor]XP_022706925.1 peptide chain release factor 1-like, mitochondrial isoform X1 [Varroa jacobsoni]
MTTPDNQKHCSDDQAATKEAAVCRKFAGGLRRGVLSITGYDVGRVLKLESGVHRVQRVPKTEKSGRIHTSTATVAVLACPPEVEVNIEPRDLIVKTKRAGGPGGQHVNKTESAVQILHVPTGIMVESDTERCQQQNKSVAMKKLRAKIYDLKVSSEMNKVQSQKKLQVGNATRSEKIRTYNFTQDRITDHRLPYTVRNVEEFLQGGAPLKQIIGVLQEAYQNEQISYLIRNKLYS